MCSHQKLDTQRQPNHQVRSVNFYENATIGTFVHGLQWRNLLVHFRWAHFTCVTSTLTIPYSKRFAQICGSGVKVEVEVANFLSKMKKKKTRTRVISVNIIVNRHNPVCKIIIKNHTTSSVTTFLAVLTLGDRSRDCLDCKFRHFSFYRAVTVSQHAV